MLNALKARALLGMIGLTQVFDILIHVLNNQVEPLRIAANIVILLWLASIALGGVPIKKNFSTLAAANIITYLVLNGIFTAIHGLTNAGEPRTVMFLLIGLTTVLSSAFSYMNRQLDKT